MSDTLTEQQVDGRGRAYYDLATGYPMLPLPAELIDVVTTWTRRGLTGLEPGCGSWEIPDSEALLKKTVGTLLGVKQSVDAQIFSTFSGSIALDRIYNALQQVAMRARKSGVTVLVGEPSIDVFRLLAQGRCGFETVSVPLLAPDGRIDFDLLRNAITAHAATHKTKQLVVMLDSPANPSGSVACANDILAIAETCGRYGAVLVVDHCFLLAGVHAPASLPSIFAMAPDTCEWIGVWDTGKTIDVGGDKLGFIVTASRRLADAIRRSLAVIQTAPSRRATVVFSQLLGHPQVREYIVYLGDVCRANLETLRSIFPSTDRIRPPAAGTFACVQVPTERRTRNCSERVRVALLTAGVSTVSGSTFFAGEAKGGNFLRFALARSDEYFREACDRISRSIVLPEFEAWAPEVLTP